MYVLTFHVLLCYAIYKKLTLLCDISPKTRQRKTEQHVVDVISRFHYSLCKKDFITRIDFIHSDIKPLHV